MVDPRQQVGVATARAGVEQSRRVEDDRGRLQAATQRHPVAEVVVGGHGVGAALEHRRQRLVQTGHRHPLHRQAETGRQRREIGLLHRAFEHRDAPPADVGHHLEGRVLAPVELAPAGQRGRRMERELGRPGLGPGDVGHQVDATFAQRLEAALPLAGHGDQAPAFRTRDLRQQLAEDPRRLAVLAQLDLRRIGVDADPHLARLGGGHAEDKGQQRGGARAQSRRGRPAAQPGDGRAWTRAGGGRGHAASLRQRRRQRPARGA